MQQTTPSVPTAVALLSLVLVSPAFAEAGKPAPKISGRDLNGSVVTLDSLCAKGPVIVDFWATWCVPCMAELKAVKKLHETYKDRGLQVLAISIDGVSEAAKVRQTVTAKKWPFIVIIDSNKEITNKFQAKDVPSTYIIGTDGKIHGAHAGYLAGDEKKLEKEILALLVQQNSPQATEPAPAQ